MAPPGLRKSMGGRCGKDIICGALLLLLWSAFLVVCTIRFLDGAVCFVAEQPQQRQPASAAVAQLRSGGDAGRVDEASTSVGESAVEELYRTVTPERLARVVSAHRNHYKNACLLYTSPSPRDKRQSRMPSSA